MTERNEFFAAKGMSVMSIPCAKNCGAPLTFHLTDEPDKEFVYSLLRYAVKSKGLAHAELPPSIFRKPSCLS